MEVGIMQLSQGFQLEMIQALQVIGGATTSIFPQVEAWLLSKGEHQRALEFVAIRKDMNRYYSMIDFLFCEIFTQYRHRCFKYYRDEGELLKEHITPQQLVFFNNALLKALEIAYKRFEEQRASSWISYRSEVMRNIQMSA